MQDVTANPSKKPVASVGLSTAKLFLFKGIESKLEQIENAPDPNVKKQWKDYELLRLWTRRYKQTGESHWWAIGFAIGCASLLTVGIFYALQPQDFYQVTERQSDLNQTFQQVHRGKALAPAVMFFCEPQPFEAGHTLTSFKFDYNADKLCYSVSAYSLLRDSSTCPKVPANCWHTDCAHPVADHILCEGKPMF